MKYVNDPMFLFFINIHNMQYHFFNLTSCNITVDSLFIMFLSINLDHSFCVSDYYFFSKEEKWREFDHSPSEKFYLWAYIMERILGF